MKTNAYKLPYAQVQLVQEEIESMLSEGIIEESQSPYSSPFLLVNKRDGTKRFCVDFRRLNDCTVKDNYPMPLVEDSINGISRGRVFSTLDLISGY